MKIKYLGHSSFLIEGKSSPIQNIKLVTDPYNLKSVGFKYPPSISADILTSSHNHDDHNWYKGVNKPTDSEQVVLDTPGEYEVKGLRMIGIKSFHDDNNGTERGLNTIYVYDFELARIAHLGDLGHLPDSSILELLDGTEILFIPVGGKYTIGPKRALEIIEKIEPLIVIPMHYRTDKHSSTFDELSTVDEFLKEVGAKNEPQKELKLKSKADLPAELTFITLEY